MKRSTISRIAVLAAFVVLATAPHMIPPAVEAERIEAGNN